MKLKYVGPHDAVVLVESGAVCKRGEAVEVDADLGKRLAEQKSNWQPVKSAPEKKES